MHILILPHTIIYVLNSVILMLMLYILVLGQTQFMGSNFGLFGGFVHSSILVNEPGFRKGLKFSFSIFRLGFGPFLAEQVQSLGFLERFKKVQSSVLVGKNLGSSEF